MVKSFSSLFGKSHRGVGVEIAPERVNVVQIRKQRQGLKLESLTSVPVPEGIVTDGQITDPPAMAQLIQQALAESKIKKVSRVATGVPGRDSIVRIIPVPSELDDKELRDMVLNHEAGLYLPYPREEADVDYQKLGYFVDEDGIEKVRVLLVATRKEVTDTYISTFEQAGLQIGVLEINSFALIRTIRDQLRQFGPEEATVLVDIEFDSTEIAIIINGVPQFSRTVPIGTYQMQMAFARAMSLPTSRDMEMLQGLVIPVNSVESDKTGMTETDPGIAGVLRILGELTDELRRSIDFYLNQSENVEIAQILLGGPGGGLEQLHEFFTQRLSIPTSQIDPIGSLSLQVDEEKYPSTQRSGLGIVLGLGMREV
ncbi:Type IV pilus assembly protein PilM [Trichormus variabilis ATCC 29413]|uniref:Type IV pilus assembly protein PilM n=2 Tax=Anabaena variabilis TaxID=264691 RepID=Q3M6U4_TRIV2|nr:MULTISPECIES: type IV pilus biogenesis protein PilM [Nostocaceae]ABA23292.1 Type IV pilus assembly protein PilM [Trichormus variabilis ATCC 29413]MBC1216380.1 pilus assembly protein PilM [Trichormus variabilis ARAD]MBC1255480.1 pilus assembly protein PilM [Trichormus variabilis V5]MBC1267492.1 pilus assembly protein PilM [Trichormus variabilis FSR]MBC1304103.1 pilus assembly protein PilM [Trichormus variabilis N2B]